MANEFAELGVRVNAVAHGEIETAMLSPETEVLIPRIPLHRLGEPRDVASTIHYLCSHDRTYVTGTEIFVPGGQQLLCGKRGGRRQWGRSGGFAHGAPKPGER